MAGVSRQQYATYTKLIRVMCTGRVELPFVIRAFSNGIDGVFIGGCHLNDCHYITEGNYNALGMVLLGKKILEHIGVNPERLRMEFLSAGEGIRFAEAVNDFAAKVRELGPLGRGEGINEEVLKIRLEAVTNLLPYIKLVERERLRIPHKSEEEYRKFFASDEFGRLFAETIAGKLAISQIVSLLQKGPRTAKEIAEALGMPPSEVARHLNASAKQGLVRFAEGRICFAPA